jgi:hypothetical protein
MQSTHAPACNANGEPTSKKGANSKSEKQFPNALASKQEQFCSEKKTAQGKQSELTRNKKAPAKNETKGGKKAKTVICVESHQVSLETGLSWLLARSCQV